MLEIIIYWSFHQLLLFEEGPKRLLQSEYLYCHKELQKKTPVNDMINEQKKSYTGEVEVSTRSNPWFTSCLSLM